MKTYFSDKERCELFKNELNLIKDETLKEYVRLILCIDLKSNFFYLQKMCEKPTPLGVG